MNVAMSSWVREAAALPIAFAQVREDPRLDLEICSQLPPHATVVMIASGGDTAAFLSRLNLGRLVLVDMNPAQLALTRCKLHLARHASRQEALEWLGHAPLTAKERLNRLCKTLETLGLAENIFGPPAFVAEHGPDFVGRYERLFDALRQSLEPVRGELQRALCSESTVLDPASDLSKALQTAFDDVMSLANLVALFGSEATRNPRQPFAEHFFERTRVAFAGLEPRNNPFLWQIFAGVFPAGVCWDWLTSDSWKPPCLEPEFVNGRMFEVLEQMPSNFADVVHLSNILDWLSPSEATQLLNAAYRALKPGGKVVIRQLNSSLEIAALQCGLQWDCKTAAGMQARDRSFFYPLLHLGTKQ